MGSTAELPAAVAGQPDAAHKEHISFSLLDIVKHAMNTICSLLDQRDRLAIG